MTDTTTRRVPSSVGNPTNVAAVVQALLTNLDGATITPTGRHNEIPGYVVALPEYGAVIPWSVKDDRGRRWLTESWVKFRSAEVTGPYLRPRAFGVWEDEAGNVHLDVVEVFPTDQADEAVAAGRARNQIAIWDTVNCWEVPTGGTGGPVIHDTADDPHPLALDSTGEHGQVCLTCGHQA